MVSVILYKNKRIIPIPYEELQMLISEASNNKVGLTFSPTTPLKLLPAKTEPLELYDKLTQSLGLKGERVRNILATINPDLSNQPYIIIERI